jgi:citrate lyase subunit beta/citryl-CoA lyase
MPALQTARSFLFAPGSDEHKLRRALEAGADAVIADLEDAVAVAEKDGARALVADLLKSIPRTGCARLVRINATGTAWHADDLAAVAGMEVDGIVLPKATAESAHGVAATLPAPIVAIVETAAGLRRAYELAMVPGVARLVLGAVDLGLALGLERRDDGQELLHARSSLVVDSAAAGLPGPVDQVWVGVRDLDGLARDCDLGRSLGLRGKACIHPDQVAVVNEAFLPSENELARARDIVAAFEQAERDGKGAVALDGEMIDLPVVERARQLLIESKRSVLHEA